MHVAYRTPQLRGFGGSPGALDARPWAAVVLAQGGEEPGTPPDPPTGLSTTSISDTGATANWTDNSGGSATFEVEYASVPGDWTTASGSPTSDESLALTGLSANTTYKWRVRAVNDDGASDWVESDEFQTLAGEPVVTGVTLPASATTYVNRPLRIRAIVEGSNVTQAGTWTVDGDGSIPADTSNPTYFYPDGAGTTEVTFTSADDSNYSATMEINVVAAPPEGSGKGFIRSPIRYPIVSN